VGLAIGLPVSKQKKKEKTKRTVRKKIPRKTKKQLIKEADHLAVDLEANLLRLKEEIENESISSHDESVPISSMKGYFGNLDANQDFTRETSARDQRKLERTKSAMGKSKTLSKTLDISGNKVIKTMNRKVEKQESLRDIITNNKMSLQWRKERIKEYGRVKKKSNKNQTKPVEKNKKMKIKKINNKFGKESFNEEKNNHNQTPKRRKTVTGEYESCIVKVEDKNSKNDSYDWLIENQNINSGIGRGIGRFDSDAQNYENKKQFKLATGDQNVTLNKIKKEKEKKDKHFANLLRENTNKNNQSGATNDIQQPSGEEFSSETSLRMRRKQMKKTDLKKRLDLDRLKNLNSKMQKRNSMINSARNDDFYDKDLEDAFQKKGNKQLINRKKARSDGGIRLLKGLNSKFAIDSAHSKKSNYGDQDLSIEIKVEGHREYSRTNRSPKIISELGSGNDLMVRNTLIKEDEIREIPEYDVLEKGNGKEKKEQYRRDRIKEYGMKLKTIKSFERNKRKKVNAKEFLENI
jgi:hypothetical protein